MKYFIDKSKISLFIILLIFKLSSCSFQNHKDNYVKEFGEPAVKINQKEGEGISVEIDTKNLKIASVVPEDLKDLSDLYGNQKVMEKFFTGKVQDEKYVQGRIDLWRGRLKDNNPFVALVAKNRKIIKILL